MAVQLHGAFGLPHGSAFQSGRFAEGSYGKSSSTAGQLDGQIQRIISERQNRSKFFPEDLFADPAWDILLELALAEQTQQRVTVTSLCVGSRVPQTTALRWIKHMTDMGWLVRKDDPLDARRKWVELSSEASDRMRAYLLSLTNSVNA